MFNCLKLELVCTDQELGLHRLRVSPNGVSAKDVLVNGVHPLGALQPQHHGVAAGAQMIREILNEGHNKLNTPYGEGVMYEKTSRGHKWRRGGSSYRTGEDEVASNTVVHFLDKVSHRVYFVDDSWDYFADIYPKIFARFVSKWCLELAQVAIGQIAFDFDGQRAALKKHDPSVVVRSFEDIQRRWDLHELLKPEDVIDHQAFVTEEVLGTNQSIRRISALKELVDDQQRLCIDPNGFPSVDAQIEVEGYGTTAVDLRRIPGTPEVYEAFVNVPTNEKDRHSLRKFRKSILPHTGVPEALQPPGPYNWHVHVNALDKLRHKGVNLLMYQRLYAKPPGDSASGSVRTERIEVFTTHWSIRRASYVGKDFRSIFRQLGLRVGGNVDEQAERLLQWLVEFYALAEPVIHKALKDKKYIVYSGNTTLGAYGITDEVMDTNTPMGVRKFKKLCAKKGVGAIEWPPPGYNSWVKPEEICISKFAKAVMDSCVHMYVEKHLRGEVVFDTSFTDEAVPDEEVLRSLYHKGGILSRVFLKVQKQGVVRR
jgi:hypothetical protein